MTDLSPGQIARVRSRQYLVEDVVPPLVPGDDTRVRLSCLDDDARGEALEVLWEHEVDAELVSASQGVRLDGRGFDSPAVFGAYLRTLRWNCVSATDPRLLQAPYRAGIQVMAYQLEPLRKALLLPRVNLFIADDVGLGKTIEAGLILRELILRQKVRRVVVAAPPSVVTQWRDELEQRFGLTFQILDRNYVQRKRRERGFGVNPWSTHSRFIVSHALLRDEAYASLLRDWITNDDHLRPEYREPALFILDEAHNAAPSSGSRYAIDSRFTKVVRELAPLFEHRLFLSATPHNGHSNSFSALLEILDPHRFLRGIKATPKNVNAVMVRRLKEDLRALAVEGFPLREVVQLDLEGLPDDAPELVLPRLLDEYRTLREARAAATSERARAAAALVVTSLQKRLLSSIEAFARTLKVHRRGLEKAAERAVLPATLDAPGPDDERGEWDEEEAAAADDADVEAASAAGAAALEARERALLEEMTELAEASRHQADPRTQRLITWIREHCLDGARWNHRRVLIFTEYADTKRYLETQLRAAFHDTSHLDERIATFHGGMGEDAREEVKRAFNADPSQHPLRILIATDAAREGVNLQNHCADLFHFDVPWNPSRMEQRNGRIDRKLQRQKVVRCHYFFYSQRPEDEVLRKLVKKTRTIQTELGSLSQVLEARLGKILEGGIRRRDVEVLGHSIEKEHVDPGQRQTVEEELEVTRARQQLIEQHQGLQDLMQKAKDAIRFEEAPFKDALDAGLQLLGIPPLLPVSDAPGRYQLGDAPALKEGAWADTLDTLRPPRPRGERLWDWRKAAPLRPVVFRDPGSLDGAHVHLHLEHRLVQRVLGCFLAQGFVRDDLARAVALESAEAKPRVVLLGRLSLFGEHGSRLHDEVLAVAADYVDPLVRKAKLKALSDRTTQHVLEVVEVALDRQKPAPAVAQDKLRSSAARDFAELLPALHTLAEAEGARAERLLTARGDKEAKEMKEILEDQERRIRARQAESEKAEAKRQLDLFNEDEKRQVEAERKAWKKRLDELANDLLHEPKSVREIYQTRARRVEPVGLVYLWPVTG